MLPLPLIVTPRGRGQALRAEYWDRSSIGTVCGTSGQLVRQGIVWHKMPLRPYGGTLATAAPERPIYKVARVQICGDCCRGSVRLFLLRLILNCSMPVCLIVNYLYFIFVILFV
jgi:hypothetical protein